MVKLSLFITHTHTYAVYTVTERCGLETGNNLVLTHSSLRWWTGTDLCPSHPSCICFYFGNCWIFFFFFMVVLFWPIWNFQCCFFFPSPPTHYCVGLWIFSLSCTVQDVWRKWKYWPWPTDWTLWSGILAKISWVCLSWNHEPNSRQWHTVLYCSTVVFYFSFLRWLNNKHSKHRYR